jgi:hypothetical protein
VVGSGADILIRGSIGYFQFSEGDVPVDFGSPAKVTTLAAADVRIEVCDARKSQQPRVLNLSARSGRETTYPQEPPYEDLAKDCITQVLAQFAGEFVQTGAGQETGQ